MFSGSIERDQMHAMVKKLYKVWEICIRDKIRVHESLLLGLVENSWFKVREWRFENLPISLSSYENNMLKISH